jgi:hypothetical protein
MLVVTSGTTCTKIAVAAIAFRQLLSYHMAVAEQQALCCMVRVCTNSTTPHAPAHFNCWYMVPTESATIECLVLALCREHTDASCII